MNALDAVLAFLIILAALTGLRRGLFGPLLGELGFVLATIITIRYHSVGDSIFQGFPEWMVTPGMIIGLTVAFGFASRPVAALIRGLPLMGRVDRYGGVVLNGFLTLMVIWLLIGAVLDFDANIYPTLRTGVVTAQQIDAYREAILQNPIAAQYSDDTQLKKLRAQAARDPLPVSVFQQLNGFLDFYVHWVRNPLMDSRLARIVNDLGAKAPVIGHQRPWLKPFGAR